MKSTNNSQALGLALFLGLTATAIVPASTSAIENSYYSSETGEEGEDCDYGSEAGEGGEEGEDCDYGSERGS